MSINSGSDNNLNKTHKAKASNKKTKNKGANATNKPKQTSGQSQPMQSTSETSPTKPTQSEKITPSEILKRQEIAREFYKKQIDLIKDPGYRASRLRNLDSELSFIDYTKPVEVIKLRKGTLLGQRQGEVWSSNIGSYFSEITAEAPTVGISNTGSYTLGRRPDFVSKEFRTKFYDENGGETSIGIAQKVELLEIPENIKDKPQEIKKWKDDKFKNFVQENDNLAERTVAEIRTNAMVKQKEILPGRKVSEEERKEIFDVNLAQIHGLPSRNIKGGEIIKAMKVFEVKEEVEVLASTAKGSATGDNLMDTWSVVGKAIPITGGGIQYFTTDANKFRIEIISKDEYQKEISNNPALVPPIPKDDTSRPKPLAGK